MCTLQFPRAYLLECSRNRHHHSHLKKNLISVMLYTHTQDMGYVWRSEGNLHTQLYSSNMNIRDQIPLIRKCQLTVVPCRISH